MSDELRPLGEIVERLAKAAGWDERDKRLWEWCDTKALRYRYPSNSLDDCRALQDALVGKYGDWYLARLAGEVSADAKAEGYHGTSLITYALTISPESLLRAMEKALPREGE